MKRPVGLTNAELPAGDRPPPPLPDIEPPARAWHGGAGAELARKDARIRRLELALAQAEAVLVAQRSARGDADDVLEQIARALAPSTEVPRG